MGYVVPTDNAAEIGRWIAEVRERAGIKQNDLARRITWSPAVLSRVESGERTLSSDELTQILSSIGTPDALALKTALDREWRSLARPALDHPDQDLLWAAELIARDLEAKQLDPQVRNAFQRRLVSLLDEVRDAALKLAKREFRVAFIGGIGIGKSTAICRVAGLEVPDKDRATPVAVLEAGAGGITLCEVHVRTGPGVGIIVEPRSEDEIRADVYDFAEYIRDTVPGDVSEVESAEGTQQGVSREVERAIRNMAGLRVIRNRKDENGQRLAPIDEAKRLAESVGSTRELVVEILTRMSLQRRDRRDVWYDVSTGMSELAWLKETFEAINNGRHPAFTLPGRIEVVVTHPLLSVPEMTLQLVDTKGIDGSVMRADLEGHLDDSHTLPVLCTRFNDAPAEATQRLLQRARDSAVRGLENRALLLALPHSGEALEVKDEAGLRVGSDEEGYELKGEQIELRLRSQNLPQIKVGFFNAREDAPDRLRQLILGRVRSVQNRMREHLVAVTSSARSVLDNQEREQVQEVQRMAVRMLRASLGSIRPLLTVSGHVHEDLLEAIGRSHWSTVRAAVRREGEWPNLSYTHHLSYGARRLAVLACSDSVAGFARTCETMAATSDFSEARELIGQAERTLQTAYDELLRKVQLMGQTAYGSELRKDVAFWTDCEKESGRGYKSRIIARNEGWFASDARGVLEQEMRGLIEREWHAALARVESLFEADE